MGKEIRRPIRSVKMSRFEKYLNEQCFKTYPEFYPPFFLNQIFIAKMQNDYQNLI